MRLKEYEIVIEPREIIFEHIEPNKIFRKTLNIKNVGNRSRRMELFRPSNKVFQLIYKNPELPVPPGMEIAAVVEFETSQAQEYNDKMVICIDNKEIDIPIQAFPAKPILTVDEQVDFGLLSDNNKTITRRLKISNSGALDGEFSINYKGDLPITFIPSKDVIPAYSEYYVRVDFFTNKPDKIEEKIQIHFQGSKKINEFKIIANVMKRELILIDINTNEQINKLDFGSCYYGCNLLNMAILYNSSPDKVDYVVLLEEKGLGAEIGAELSKSTNALKARENIYTEDDFNPIGKLVSAFPNNGTLEPFEKRPIFFRFSPQYKNPKSGFSTTLKPPPRRDYALFLYFELLGNNKRTELAITGTALPILLRIDPNKMDFGSCPIGQKKEIPAIVYNDSELKDVKFKFKKVANYTVNPASGRIPPRSSRNIIVTFLPHQMGTFNYALNCQVIDKVADSNNPLNEFDKGIWDFPIELQGTAIEITNIPVPKYSGGMMPLITNEVGLNVNTTAQNLKSFQPKIAVQNAPRDHLHRISYAEKIKPGKESDYKIAFPNDRSKSIGPFNRYEKFKTLYTGADRYNYIDPDYAYTEEEIKRNENHKMVYKKYLDNLRFYRSEKLRNKDHYAYNNSLEIGLKPSCGLKPQELNINEVHKEVTKPEKDFKVNSDWELVGSEELSKKEKLLKNSVSNTTLSLSIKDKEKVSVHLNPAQIYKIIVTPSVIDFGEVAVKSVSIKNLEFLNTLDQPIHVELETDCNELGQTNPVGQVIPPKAKGTFPIIFESDYVQTFQRSISYRINFSYRHHVIILADVKLPSLKLNTNHIVLTQIPGVQPDLCYRSNITVMNPFNATAEFSWIPIYGEQGTAFSIRPASGTIEPFKDLECEVVWHGSFLAPLKGTFSLQVRGGEATTLNCEAKLGSSQLQFISRRSNFGKIPINMTSTKTFYLTNNGTHNAYFQVLDTKPIPGMVITPEYGLAPLNALTAIKCEINPVDIIKFDARVLIQVRGGRQLELRLSGESEEPIIDISLPNFDFGGVFSGATSSLPFKLVNKSKVKANVEFDLKKYADFSIKTKDKSIHLNIKNNNYETVIEENQSIDLDLTFSPTEVASYEFDLPLFVNRRNDDDFEGYESVSPYQTERRDKTPLTRKSSRYSLFTMIPKRKITAIGLRNAIHLTNPKINFNIPITYFEKLKEGGFFEAKSTLMINKSHRSVKWCIDMRKSNKVLEDGIFKLCDGSLIPFVSNDKKSYGPEGELQPNESYELKVLFSPDKPGVYNCNFPIVINNNFDQPYYNIQVIGELRAPEIYFEPEILVLKPVPLGVEINETFSIKQRGYDNKTKLRLEIPNTKSIDGEEMNVISTNFVQDSQILPENESSIAVNVKFSSSKPISNTIKLKFKDEHNREFFYNIVVTSDNSLFTCYEFLADHNSDYQIVLETGQIMKGTRNNKQSALASESSGEPILRPFTTASGQSNNQTVSPTFDMNPSADELSPLKDRDDIIQACFGNMSLDYKMDSRISALTKGQEPIIFPSSDHNSGIFAFEILKVLQRWFKCNGWPNSHNLVKIPDSFRGGVSRKPIDDGKENIPQQDAIKRENKTIYEMIAFLCGRALPAIPLGAPVPNDIAERTFQFYWQHNVFLKFLETEGGCVAQIKPDHLLDIKEFNCWIEQKIKKKDLDEINGYSNNSSECAEAPIISPQLFPLVSKKAWLDCLLQLLKISVLNRITPKTFKASPVPYNKDATFPDVKTDPLISNIYSIGERILLAWLNYCYTNYKDKIWFENDRGGVPSSRWIVNFDADLTDSLALAAVIGAYCPFTIESHFKRMYIIADTAEKCFHNALILIDCVRKIGLDYDINSLDITDPNPISMILFCAYLFNKMPSYLPSADVDFSSPLHQVASKKIKISNPSLKNIFYEAIIVGQNSESFSLPKGKELPIPPKSHANLQIDFNGNNLKPGNAYLILVGRKKLSIPAETIVFCLNTSINDLTAKKIIKFQSALYKPIETKIDIENPYNHGGEFRITILESDNKNGAIMNPYFTEATSIKESFDLKKSFKQAEGSKASLSSMKSLKENNLLSPDKLTKKDEDFPIYSAFYTKTESIILEPRGKSQIIINYLPLQLIKHSAVIIFSNEKVGEFLYYLEGSPSTPEPCKVIVDEKALDPNKIKLIKSSKYDNKTLTFRCFVGDRVQATVLIPVCNLERENAIVMSTEMRMTDLELSRRKVHGYLSSKSLLESLERLTLNKKSQLVESTKSSVRFKNSEANNTINYLIQTKNSQFLSVQNNLIIKPGEIKSDENLVPLTFYFESDRQGTFNTTIELKHLPNDIRVIPVEFRVTENALSESNVAYLQFTSSVFESIVQHIPIKNNSESPCHYEVEINSQTKLDPTIFRGFTKFLIKPKDIYNYELKFTPNAEEKFEAELRFNNLTEGTHIKYILTGIGERAPPIGEIKLDTKVGQITTHEIMIPNKSNKKTCFYIYSTASFIKGPEKLMILPNRKEPYVFQIQPTHRGDFKGAITFKPGEWPIKDIDSDGDEICMEDQNEKPQQFCLWLSYDIKVQPPPYQAFVEIEANSLDSSVLCIPLSNPFNKKMEFRVIRNGPFLSGDDKIEIGAKDKCNYELKFSPIQVGKFRGSLIFINDETGEFWYDLKLISTDPLPIQTEVVEAEIGRYTVQTLKLKNPLNEQVTFRTLISNTSNFSLEKKQDDRITLEANGETDINVIFSPSAVGLSDHFGIISFFNEKVGNISYELKGIGTEPDTQDPINITSEICSSEMVTINFRNSTDSAIYVDLNLIDGSNNKINLNDETSVFKILINKFENVHISPKAILDIPIVFAPNELKCYDVNLVINARREGRMNWVEQDPKKKIEKLKWVYPIKAYSVINAINKAAPFLLECMVKQRKEKRMEVVLANVTSYSSGMDRASMKLRSVTPKTALTKSITLSDFSSSEPNNIKSESSNSFVMIGDSNNLASEFVHTLHFSGNMEQCDLARNSIAIKLIRIQRDKTNGLVTLLFDIIFCPSKSFMVDANLQIETTLGGIWRYPLRIIAVEPPPDDTIILEAHRLNKESIVGFRLSSKIDHSIPFKAQFVPNGDQVFSVSPSSGELLAEKDEGTLIKVGFTPPAYGKIYQNQLVITTPTHQWKYLVKGVTPEYRVPRGQSAIQSKGFDPKTRRYGKKRNYIIENTYIIQTAVSSPYKGAALMPIRYANLH